MSADEAKAYGTKGLVDHVVESRKQVKAIGDESPKDKEKKS
jgi:hypothetical protein